MQHTLTKTPHQYNDDLFIQFANTVVLDEQENIVSFDERLRNKITNENERLVNFVIEKFYSKSPASIRDDLAQEGRMGLMEAIPRFNPNLGFRFSTYATYWIRQAISSFLVANKGAPSTPSHVRLAYNKLLKEAKKNEVGLKDLVAAFSEGHEEQRTLGDTIEAPIPPPEENMDHQKLICAVKNSLTKLNQRQRLILLLRYNLITAKDLPNSIH